MAWPTWYVDLTVASGQWSGSPVVAIPVASALLSATSLLDPTAQHHAQNGGGDWLAFRGHSFAERVPLDVIECTTAANPSERALHLAVSTTSLGSGQTLRLAGGSTEGLKSQPAANATYGRHAVYPADTFAWSLSEDPAGSAPQMLDRTSHAAHLTSHGSMTSGQSVAGVVGRGLSLDGVDDNLLGTLPLIAEPPYAMSVWLRLTGNASSGNNSVIRLDSANDIDRAQISWLSGNRPIYNGRLDNNVGGAFSTSQLNANLNDSAWHVLTAVSVSRTTHRLYHNGTLVSEATTGTLNVGADFTRLIIGGHNQRTPGVFDQPQLRLAVPSEGDLRTQYNAESNNAAFWSVGPVTRIRRGGLLRRILAEGGVL